MQKDRVDPLKKVSEKNIFSPDNPGGFQFFDSLF